MIRLLIIADDFTGGLDTGVQFASRGIPVCVLTNPDEDMRTAAGNCEVLVVVTGTRHLPAAEAGSAVGRVVRKSMESGIPYIYKKTDSALRGNIGAELSAAAAACGASVLPFIPALPVLNRVTRNGIQYIDGVPAAESVFGRDPFNPVTESDVTKLVALQSSLPAGRPDPDHLQSFRGIAVLDAETDGDLLRVGRQISRAGALRLTAGCAGFASVLPDLLGLARGRRPVLPKLDPGLFVLCGSLNPVTRKQLEYAEAHGFTRIRIPAAVKLHPEDSVSARQQALFAGWRQQMETKPWMILDAGSEDPSGRGTADCAAAAGIPAEEVRKRISESLGIILEALAASPSGHTLLITGGDTLLECMNRLEVYRMMPLLEVSPGVVLSGVTLRGQSRFVIAKSGGFGSVTLLQDLKELIEKQPAS